MSENPDPSDPLPEPPAARPGRPRRLRAAAQQALARERRALRRSAFSMGAALRSSATLAGLERDGELLARRAREAAHELAGSGRLAGMMDKASAGLSAWTARLGARTHEWARGSRTISGLGIDAQRVRRRLARRREDRGHRTH